MSRQTPRSSPAAVALVVVVGLAVCMMAAAVMVPTMLGGVGAWPVLAGGVVALVGALWALWVIQRKRDRMLSFRSGPGGGRIRSDGDHLTDRCSERRRSL